MKKIPILNTQLFIWGRFFFVTPNIVEDGPVHENTCIYITFTPLFIKNLENVFR